jgi:hypothetical protein
MGALVNSANLSSILLGFLVSERSTLKTLNPLILALFILLTPFFSVNASASVDQINNKWTIKNTDASKNDFLVSGGQWIIKQPLIPEGLAEISDDFSIEVNSGRNLISVKKGHQLIEVTNSKGVFIFCDPKNVRQYLIKRNYHLCFIDEMADGTFNSFFITPSSVSGILAVEGYYPRKPKPMNQVSYLRLPADDLSGGYFVGIELIKDISIFGNGIQFSISFGQEDQKELGRITEKIEFSEKMIPGNLQIIGANISILSRDARTLRVKVLNTIPQQVFSIKTGLKYQ